MKKMLISALLLGLLAPLATLAQEQSPEEMQKAWMAYMMPTEMHQMLAKGEGKWDIKSQFWMDPSAPPEESTGTCENKMIMGGRYLEGVQTMSVMGMPMTGRSVMGFDNAKQVFVSTWIDNMGTGIAMCSGKWDENTKSIMMTGAMTDPMTKADTKFDMELKFEGPDTQILTMWSYMGEKKFRSMVQTYTRPK